MRLLPRGAGRSEDGLPLYAAPQLRDRWFPHARFDHHAHRMMKCADCHDAERSTQSSDVLIPTIDKCKKCHNATAGKARSDCVECHGYHDHGGDRRDQRTIRRRCGRRWEIRSRDVRSG